MELTTVWFAIIAFVWIGYFVLEGFDFGVGILVGVLGGRSDRERRVVINTIGPHWDGNEVWLVVAAGATFAAFPDWYATVFSGFYLPVLAILVALILRAVAFEYRGKRRELAWRRRWDACIVVGSAVPAVAWGVAFGNMVRGVPVDATGEYVGGVANLLTGWPVTFGLASLALFTTHGAVFLALKTDGSIRVRARALAGRVGVVALTLVAAASGWMAAREASAVSWGLCAATVAGLAGALAANRSGREGWAFTGTTVSTAALFTAVFVALFPDVLPSSLDSAWSLTTTNAASTPYTLRIMTVAAAVAAPVVLLYQGWTYWVFRRRIVAEHITDDVLLPERPHR